MTNQQYQILVKRCSPPSPMGKDCTFAFLIGGSICALGQAICNGYQAMGLGEQAAGLAMSLTLVALSALLTGLNVYDDVARLAGAGTLVPITGFANAVASAAMEFRTEGFITGVGAKMFTIAGPVIVYGTTASVVYGLLYWLASRF